MIKDFFNMNNRWKGGKTIEMISTIIKMIQEVRVNTWNQAAESLSQGAERYMAYNASVNESGMKWEGGGRWGILTCRRTTVCNFTDQNMLKMLYYSGQTHFCFKIRGRNTGKKSLHICEQTSNFALRRSLHRLSERVYNAWQEVINHSSYHFIKELLRQAGDHMTSVRPLVCLWFQWCLHPPQYVATTAQISYLH